MLHPYLEASRIQIPFAKLNSESTPGWELLSMLCEFNEWLDVSPSVQSLQEKTIYILYRDVAILLDDFWDVFGQSMARINMIWPFSAFGTARNQETICISAQAEEAKIQLVQKSISGKDTDVLKTLCFQIECSDNKTAENLIHFLTAMNWRTGIAAINWKDADFPGEQKLLVDSNSRSLFCYTAINQQVTPSDLLYSLDFTQKITLWTAFLNDGFQPVEFEWLADEISKDSLINRMEWELALRETMAQLHFQIINQEKTFEVFDATGKRLYFGVDGCCAAEWVLLKILFPLNYK